MQYLVVAYRYGWKNNGSYFVGCWTERDTAITFATSESATSGGKYGVTVYEFDGQDQKIVHHSPSAYGEEKPYFNRRIQLFESFGSTFVPVIESGNNVTQEVMVKFVKSEKKKLDIIYGGRNG